MSKEAADANLTHEMRLVSTQHFSGLRDLFRSNAKSATYTLFINHLILTNIYYYCVPNINFGKIQKQKLRILKLNDCTLCWSASKTVCSNPVCRGLNMHVLSIHFG